MMKKVMFACLICGALLLCGCKSSAINNAREYINNGDYASAAAVLEKYADDAEAAPILHEARLNLALIDAQAKLDEKNYSEAANILEEFKDDSNALELYSTAKTEELKENLAGYWQCAQADTLVGAYVNVKTDNGISAVLEHSVNNYYGYSDKDTLWKSAELSETGEINFSLLKRGINGSENYVTVSANLNTEDNTLTFADNLFGKWKKITKEEAQTAAKSNPLLTKTYDGTAFQISPNALTYLGKKRSQASKYAKLGQNYTEGELPFVYEYYHTEFDAYLYDCYIFKGGCLNNSIFPGMTVAQLKALEKSGTLKNMAFENTQDGGFYCAAYNCTYNGVTENLTLTFFLNTNKELINSIRVQSSHFADLESQQYSAYTAQKQREQEELEKYAQPGETIYPFIGKILTYMNTPYGQVAVCEPYAGHLFVGDICMIENYSLLEEPLFMLMYQGNLRRTNRTLMYQGKSYPIFQAVIVRD